jgi:hypothetical protein
MESAQTQLEGNDGVSSDTAGCKDGVSSDTAGCNDGFTFLAGHGNVLGLIEFRWIGS